MEKLTLAQWVRNHQKTLTFNREDNSFSCDCPHYETARTEVEKGLEDFDIISAGPTLHFHGPYLKSPVKTREEFLTLSYFTLCGISDTLMVSSIDGMIWACDDNRCKGLLYTDTLGNFLMIE